MTIQQILPFESAVNADSLPALTASNGSAGEEMVLAFIETFSKALLKQPESRALPELVALGFWLRRANIQQVLSTLAVGEHKPLGLVVHYTPANVDTMFVYSWICALLMGNRNIVRLSSREGHTQGVLVKVMRSVMQLPEYQDVAAANQFVRFEREHADNAYISLLADARVLWGGDDSVSAIRALPCKPRCRDISFADRYSASYIDFNGVTDIRQTAELFWRECEPFEQQACSSPRILFWRGNSEHWDAFTNELSSITRNAAPSLTRRNEQLIYSQWCQANGLVSASEQAGSLNLAHVETWKPDLLARHTGQYSVCCKAVINARELLQYDDPRWQTLSYAGVSKDSLFKIFAHAPIAGIDRVVPLGNALAFSSQWDGYELLSQLARRVVFE